MNSERPLRLSNSGPVADNALDRPLALAAHLLDSFCAFAFQFSGLGAIDLPPIVQSEANRKHIQAAAVLYLAAELEAAQLLPAVESLAGLFAAGALRLEGEPANLLYEFWQGRHERFSPKERRAIFARLFGHASATRLAVTDNRNRDFPSQMLALAEAILSLEPDPVFGSRPLTTSALAAAASRIAASLSNRSGGVSGYAARDLANSINQALRILKLRPVQATVGAPGVWSAVETISRMYLDKDVRTALHVERGKSGMLILTWVGEILPQLDMVTTSQELLPQNSHIYNAAFAWLQATYELLSGGEAQPQSQHLVFPKSGLVPMS